MNKEFILNALAVVVSVIALFFGDNLRERFGMSFVTNAIMAIGVGVASVALLKLFDAYWNARKSVDALSLEAKECLIFWGKRRGFAIADSSIETVRINGVQTGFRIEAVEELEARGFVNLFDGSLTTKRSKRLDDIVTIRRYLLNNKGIMWSRFARK